jgi:RND superfamily putative drug exporter
MGKKLHQLGRYFFTHPWRVVVVWIVFFGLFSTGAVTQYKQPTNAITIPGTKADTTLQTMTRLFPDAGRGSARVVVQASHDKTIKDYAPAIETFVANAVTVDGVKAAVSPFVNTQSLSNDGKTAIIQLQLTEANGAVPEATTQAVEKKSG